MATHSYRSRCQLGIGWLCWRCAAVAGNKRVLEWSVAGAPCSLRSLEQVRKGISASIASAWRWDTPADPGGQGSRRQRNLTGSKTLAKGGAQRGLYDSPTSGVTVSAERPNSLAAQAARALLKCRDTSSLGPRGHCPTR